MGARTANATQMGTTCSAGPTAGPSCGTTAAIMTNNATAVAGTGSRQSIPTARAPCALYGSELRRSREGERECDTHGGGLGKKVIAEAEKRVQDLWQCNQMVMTVINVRTALIEWYERRGYHLTGATLPFPFSETTGETTRDFHLSEMRKTLG